ncbi:unnamed protein product [Cuscuta epithymum]|uniref:DUF4283 domain-containing protein n=1 Tax=Cuscuta epithymum TaxID=186058 RepID=A0AAV0G567_9ASTE|nr:unnamed protein product [Cuscuta epithymum]
MGSWSWKKMMRSSLSSLRHKTLLNTNWPRSELLHQKSRYVLSQFRDIMASVWKPEKGVTITEIGPRRYVFQFYNEEDMNRVADEGPWVFDQNLIVLSRLKEGDIPISVPLNKADFWVQVHDIPVGYFCLDNVERIGNFLGNL